ncbi:LexA family protein [Desulfitobacterium chlororespirans]|uniref:Peptidase S24-like n=1 Tax=Desulfitobacterium chlororespirans DSM 11544 TaxID=1121395 RepID=A0A1M7U3T1_9FIRM|nr:S24 family peptidase [Desulfitobacterium chlororespirans]SHN77628.1 Peptidase S24-like [Desulfitobacterium chlororespirans DSM 11544]
MNNSVIAVAIGEIRGSMTDAEFADALKAFTDGKFSPSSNTIQKYRTGQREPSYENLQSILAYGTKTNRISPETAEKLMEFFHLGELMSQYAALIKSDNQPYKAAEEQSKYIADKSNGYREVPILSRIPLDNASDEAHEFIAFPSTLLANEEYFFIRGSLVEGKNIKSDDLVLVRKTSIAESNQTVIAKLNGGVICKKFFKTDDNSVILLPSSEDSEPVPLDAVRIIGVVERVIKNI